MSDFEKKSTFAKIFEAAALCRQQGLDVPMLVLVYTALDTLAWALYNENVSKVGERFISLCDTYVIPTSDINCTALDLYAARCSILHTLGWESELSKKGKAKAVIYSFGTDDPALALATLEITNPGQFVAVKADDLLRAAQKAVETVAALASTDKELAQRLSLASGKQYRTIESGAADQMFAAFIQRNLS